MMDARVKPAHDEYPRVGKDALASCPPSNLDRYPKWWARFRLLSLTYGAQAPLPTLRPPCPRECSSLQRAGGPDSKGHPCPPLKNPPNKNNWSTLSSKRGPPT